MRKRAFNGIVLPAGLGLIILVTWELVVRIADLPHYLLPAPSAVLIELTAMGDVFARNIPITLAAIGVGYASGVILGTALAGLIVFFPAARAAVYPMVLATQTTPKIAIAPILVVWFGVGLPPKIIIVALLAFFPVLINTVTGLESVPREEIRLMESVNASQWEVYRHLRIPHSIPNLFAGLKLALTVSIIGAIVGEWIASTKGLGFLLVFYNSTLNTTRLFAVLTVLMLLASSTFALVAAVEQRLSWGARMQRAQESTTIAAGASY